MNILLYIIYTINKYEFNKQMADRGRILSTVITIVYRTLTFFLNVMKYSLAYTFDLTVLKHPMAAVPAS